MSLYFSKLVNFISRSKEMPHAVKLLMSVIFIFVNYWDRVTFLDDCWLFNIVNTLIISIQSFF